MSALGGRQIKLQPLCTDWLAESTCFGKRQTAITDLQRKLAKAREKRVQWPPWLRFEGDYVCFATVCVGTNNFQLVDAVKLPARVLGRQIAGLGRYYCMVTGVLWPNTFVVASQA
jgi:hypothetical protein